MIAQVIYRKFDEKIEEITRKLRKLGAEIIFTKGEKDAVWINSYNVWSEGDEYDVEEGYYDVKIYEMIKRTRFGVSS
ncbi:hypothetical protein DDW11_04945 [Sulfolobus sp. SCGC AB-777_G06]|uniref:hypothetical protein n=1 Tax=Stygiolobus sp. CP850M TaxID=3133134 RepID=UPI000D56A983|nr:hypothetical protein [Sulfolobaceae archaeon]PVU74870.1 hypothetical protein DDW11_04945 [Sulfolobus sp. SCGC AB-777_G06]